jgi:hypothetical protein
LTVRYRRILRLRINNTTVSIVTLFLVKHVLWGSFYLISLKSGHISRVHKDESMRLKINIKKITKGLPSRRRNKLLEGHIQKEVKNRLNSYL